MAVGHHRRRNGDRGTAQHDPPEIVDLQPADHDQRLSGIRGRRVAGRQDAPRTPRPQPSEFGTVLVPLVIVFPGVAATCAVMLYLATSPFHDPRDNGLAAFLAGAAVGLVAWLVAAFSLRRLSRASRANIGVYEELAGEYWTLRGRLESVVRQAGRDSDVLEAMLQLDAVASDLGLDDANRSSVGARWLLGSGYTAVWRSLHRAEECMFDVEPASAVVGHALYDELRLQGARMPKSDQLASKLRTALMTIAPKSGVYLEHPPHAGRDSGAASDDARAVLRQVRHSINEFRDDRRDGLVRARNALFATAVYTGVVSYLVIGLALVTAAPQRIVTAASAFFLVGATVGLFRHLRLASARDTVMEEDYGLSTARLIQRPLFSGLAAVGGVILTALVPRLTPSGTTTAGTTEQLGSIFSLTAHPEYLVVAAIFGLAPTLLMSGLQRQVESYKADLKSSEAAETAD